jgi:hypothetical protein
LAFTFANFRRPESLSSLLLLSLSPLLLLSPLLSSSSELLLSDPSELLPRSFPSELAVLEPLALLLRDTSLGLAVAKLPVLLSRATTFGLAARLLLVPLPRATPAGLTARLLLALLSCATSARLTSSALLFLAQISVCSPETLPFLSPPSLTGVSLAVLPREDTIESEAVKDIAGELSRRRRSLLPDGPAMGRSSAAVSGLFLAAGGVRTRAAFSCFFPAAGEVLGFGVEVVLGPLAAFFFFVPLFSVSPYNISPGKQSLRMK